MEVTMPRGFTKSKHPEMYNLKKVTRTKRFKPDPTIAKGIAEKIVELQVDRLNPFKESMPFIAGAWAKYLRGGISKETLHRIVESLAVIWRNENV
jgi:hypothetical protein